MTDEERELPPQQEAAVRRLLAEARATEPIPADVAARLDRVLVGLGEEGFPRSVSGHVVAPPWRRRRATVVLVAAAAVVAIGVGLGQLDGIQDGADDGANGGSADSFVTAERAPGDGALDDADGADEGAAPTEAASAYASSPDPRSPVGRVRDDRFTADVNQLRRAIPDDAVDGEFVQLTADQLPPGYVDTDRAFECAPARYGPGVLVPVIYDGTPFVLAYHPVVGESQVVDLLRCGTGESVRSTTLRAG
jgi:hypothetical protein